MADSPINQAAYGRHRKATGLPGDSRTAVKRAVDSGRLRESLVMVDGLAWIRDVALADAEWARNTDASMQMRAAGYKSPPAALAKEIAARAASVPPPTIDTPPEAEPGADEPDDLRAATLRHKNAQADLAELKFQQEAAQLIPAKDVERQLTSYLVSCKTALLALPSRARQELPHLSTADCAVIEKIVREALSNLAGGEES